MGLNQKKDAQINLPNDVHTKITKNTSEIMYFRQHPNMFTRSTYYNRNITKNINFTP